MPNEKLLYSFVLHFATPVWNFSMGSFSCFSLEENQLHQVLPSLINLWHSWIFDRILCRFWFALAVWSLTWLRIEHTGTSIFHLFRRKFYLMIMMMAFPCLWGLWGKVWGFIPCLHLFFFFWGGGVVGISLHTLIPLFNWGSVHSGSASWDNCGRVSPMSCV